MWHVLKGMNMIPHIKILHSERSAHFNGYRFKKLNRWPEFNLLSVYRGMEFGIEKYSIFIKIKEEQENVS